jgi:hypothetical protein
MQLLKFLFSRDGCFETPTSKFHLRFRSVTPHGLQRQLHFLPPVHPLLSLPFGFLFSRGQLSAEHANLFREVLSVSAPCCHKSLEVHATGLACERATAEALGPNKFLASNRGQLVDGRLGAGSLSLQTHSFFLLRFQSHDLNVILLRTKTTHLFDFSVLPHGKLFRVLQHASVAHHLFVEGACCTYVPLPLDLVQLQLTLPVLLS